MKLWRALVALLLVGSLGLAACGDDDDNDAASPTGDNGEQAAGGENEDFCGTVQKIMQAGEPDIHDDTPPEEAKRIVEDYFATLEPLSADAVEQAPADVQSDVEAMNTALQEAKTAENPQEVFEQPDIIEADSNINAWVGDNCAFAEDAVELAAVEYAFNGVPETVASGEGVVIRLNNEGQEFHELALARINDDVTASVEELLQMPQEEAEQKIEFAGGGFAAPGNTDLIIIENLEPGRYGLVCFIPVGSTQEAFEKMMETGEEPDGPPHFTRGMFAELTVE